MRYAALLRAVNLGPTNKVPMAELRARMAETGFADVRTYIQSGNITFTTDISTRRDITATIETLIRDRFGVRTPVVLRTRDEIAAALDRYPFPLDSAPEKLLHVMFLAEPPDPTRAAALDPARDPSVDWVLDGADLFVRYQSGVAGSKFTNQYIDKTLCTVSTGRNIRTVRAILDLMDTN